MKKTKDGRIIEKRVKINLKKLNKIVSQIKRFHNLTWKELATKLSVSEHTIRVDWLIKGNTIPFSLFIKLLGLHPKLKMNHLKSNIEILNPFWGQKIGVKSQIDKQIRLPSIYSQNFAELYGAMLGDGCIYSNLTGIVISGHSILDKDYLEEKIGKIIHELFNIKPKFYYSKTNKSIRCVVYSKKIALFFKELGFPIGKKINKKLVIPEPFFRKEILIRRCLRGLYDTDGSIYPQKNNLVLDISIKNKNLLKSCVKAFKKINLCTKTTTDRVYFRGEEKINKFFRTISSSNNKHRLKYEFYIKNGYIPKSEYIENYLKEKFYTKNESIGPVV